MTLQLHLHAKNIVLERAGRRILADLSFDVAAGTALAVTGPNGAGKSTLLRAIAGLLPLAGGSISCAGLPEDTDLATNAHYLGHSDGLKSALSAEENLDFWSDMLGGGGLSPNAALARIGLPRIAEFPVAYLSAGQKRRVALARLLVAHRPVWLLDEPTTALDAQAQGLFATIVQAHLGAGGMVIAATHASLGIPAMQELQITPRRSQKPS